MYVNKCDAKVVKNGMDKNIEQMEIKLTASSLGSSLSSIVSLNALKEILTALRVLNVLNAEMNALLDETVANDLVDLNTDSAGGHVPHNAGAAVVQLVRHALVDGTIALDVNVVTQAVRGQIGGHVRETMAPERLAEQISGLGAVTERVRHFL